MKKIAFTGGGTGGHVYPALAVIETLKTKSDELDIIWIGQKNGVEEGLVKSLGITFFGISAGKLRRYFSLQNVTDLFKIVKAYGQARAVLKREKPQLLFSKGGFVSLPPVVAAYFLKIPVFLHESDSDPGLANRLAAPFASKIFVPYEETKKAFNSKYHDKIELSGNPVRKAVVEANRQHGRKLYKLKDEDFLILVLGGSSGAKQVNDMVASIAPELSQRALIIHQMGPKLFVSSSNPRYITLPYINDELPDLMAACDLVISRAGAGAIWEFATLGLVPIFIPLGMRGDQARNAALLEKRGACRVLKGDDATSEKLLDVINRLLIDKNERDAMSHAMKTVVTFDSKEFIADRMIDCLKKS